MSEDIYAKPDLTKKVRFKAGEKEDRNTDACDDINSVRIYDNCWAEDSTPGDKSEEKSEDKSGDNRTEDQQQMSSVGVSSGKRNGLRAAAVILGLLCLLLLVALIVLVVLFITERNQLQKDNVDLTRARDKLQTSNSEMTSIVHNLTNETNEIESLNNNLTREKNEMERLNNNLISQLENQKDSLNNRVKDFNKKIDELQKQIGATCCPEDWTKFGKSCYLMPNAKKNWQNSQRYCETHEAHLVIISSQEEQEFISLLNRRVWIGLTYIEKEIKWEWVDGTTPTRTYWRRGQPNNSSDRDCALGYLRNWNDVMCSATFHFICEKMLK